MKNVRGFCVGFVTFICMGLKGINLDPKLMENLVI